MTDLYDFSVHDTLEPRIFENWKLKALVRERLLEISDKFIVYLGIPFTPAATIVTGSLANFNYSVWSDLDLHILADFSQWGDSEDQIHILQELFISKKSVWNNLHSITILDYEVELYVQDTAEIHFSSGVYNVTTDDWIHRPHPDDIPQIDEYSVKVKAEDVMKMIDSAVAGNYDFEQLNHIKDKIRKMRRSGLAAFGEYSVENLAFKVLRRSGYVQKLLDTKRERFDKDLSLEHRGHVMQIAGHQA